MKTIDKKFWKKAKLLIPFSVLYEEIKRDKNYDQIFAGYHTSFSFIPLLLYFMIATGPLGPNPLKWPANKKIYEAKKDSIQKIYNIKMQAFPGQIYQKIAGKDGVIDSAEFVKFYNEQRDSLSETYFTEVYNYCDSLLEVK